MLLSTLSSSSITVVHGAPQHFSEAETWDEAYELLAPWAAYMTASEVLDDVVIFSNVGSAEGALTLYREMQGGGRWTRTKRFALTSVTSNAHLLQHLGALAATVTTATGAVIELFGIAANLYKVCEREPGPWVFETISQKTNCSGGTCHTEQLCLHHLHQHLLTLDAPPRAIDLQWYTEKSMCDLWCVPTLALFIEHWGSKGATVGSTPSEILR